MTLVAPTPLVTGSWNESHTVWTTANGGYKVVRRHPTAALPGAWMVRRTFDPGAGTSYPTFGEARKAVAALITNCGFARMRPV